MRQRRPRRLRARPRHRLERRQHRRDPVTASPTPTASSLAVVGLFTTALFVTHLAMQIPGGRAADRFGARRAGLVGLFIIIAFNGLALVAPEPALAIVAAGADRDRHRPGLHRRQCVRARVGRVALRAGAARRRRARRRRARARGRLAARRLARVACPVLDGARRRRRRLRRAGHRAAGSSPPAGRARDRRARRESCATGVSTGSPFSTAPRSASASSSATGSWSCSSGTAASRRGRPARSARSRSSSAC